MVGVGADIAFVLDRVQQFAGLRNHWGWDFLFALIYAMVLDRWMKVTLLEGASPCEEVDNLRRSIVSVRLLVFAACFLLLAMVMSMARLEGVADTRIGWRVALGVTVILGTVLTWLPHLFFWTTLFALLALMLPALSAAEPTSISQGWVAGRPVRAPLFRLIFGAALFSLLVYAATQFGLQLLPKKPWAAGAMAGLWRPGRRLLLPILPYLLAPLLPPLPHSPH